MSQTKTGKVSATFNIDGEMWDAFQSQAKARGASPEEVLTEFVKAYLDSASDPLTPDRPATTLDTATLDRYLDRRLSQYLKKGETDYLDTYLDNYLVDNLESYLQHYLSRYLARYLEELQGVRPEAQVTAALSLGGELGKQGVASITDDTVLAD